MIEYRTDDLLNCDAEALVNTVNCVGVMGKGIALAFKTAFPANFKAYERACKMALVRPGSMYVTATGDMFGPKWVVNFPTKDDWRNPSKLEWIKTGLEDLIAWVRTNKVRSIAVPALGCSNGGLSWAVVQPLIVEAFAGLPDVTVYIYPPQGN